MSSTCPEPGNGGRRTLIVAHRGASGYLPEHTAAAKVLGYGLGADLLEQDVVATRDEELVVLHDVHLDDVSDVAQRFPGRQRADGRFHVADFSRAELAAICLEERRRPGESGLLYPGRYPFRSSEFRVLGFEEEIRLIAGMNRSTGRRVGIYPEIKQPDWHAACGIDLTRLVHEALARCREHLTGPVFVQSFDPRSLRRMRDELGADWPLVQLLDRGGAEALAGNRAVLKEIAAYAAAIGLPYTALLEITDGGISPSRLAQTLRDHDIRVHPYTLRRDVAVPGASYGDTLRFLINVLEVDALFCDFPDDAVMIRDGSVA